MKSDVAGIRSDGDGIGSVGHKVAAVKSWTDSAGDGLRMAMRRTPMAGNGGVVGNTKMMPGPKT